MRSTITLLMLVVGDARFALLGEASHGTHEVYHERAEITKRLIEDIPRHAARPFLAHLV